MSNSAEYQWFTEESKQTPLYSCTTKRKADAEMDFDVSEGIHEKRQCVWPSQHDGVLTVPTVNQASTGQNVDMATGEKSCIVFETGIQERGMTQTDMDCEETAAAAVTADTPAADVLLWQQQQEKERLAARRER